MMYHLCLIPFSIIDMNLAVFCKQLNNLLACMLSPLGPGEDKRQTQALYFFSRRRWVGRPPRWRLFFVFCFLMDQLCFNGAPCIHANKSSHLPGTALLDEPGLTGDGRILKHAHTCSLQQQCCSFLPGRSRV